MINYVNGFSIATDKDKAHLLIRFAQELPTFDGEDAITRENITDVLLDREVALQLIKMADDIMAEE